MRYGIFLSVIVLLLGIPFGKLSAQESRPAKPADQQKQPLPEIQLKEYTIVGLAKVSLPRKYRTRIFKQVRIRWTENREIQKKEAPDIVFRFSHVKPLLLRLYEFPWLESGIRYGSFNTAGIHLNSQFRIKNMLPYFSARFKRSDGHLPNAQWTSAGLKSGFHYQISRGHLFHIGTNYRFDKKGIWRQPEMYPSQWEMQSAFWKWFGSLEQQWHPVFSTRVSGAYFIDDHENAFQYSERGAEAEVRSILHVNRTRVIAEGNFLSSKITRKVGNLASVSPDSLPQNDYRATLYSGKFTLQQQWRMFTLRGGVLYQLSEEKYLADGRVKTDSSYLYPHAALSLGLAGTAQLTISYAPAAEFFRLRRRIRMLPFSDVSEMRVIEFPSRWSAALLWQREDVLKLALSASSFRANRYPVPLTPADTLKLDYALSDYPGWIFRTVEEVKIDEITVKLESRIVPRLHFSGWLLWRKSDIRQNRIGPLPVAGNRLPYFPQIRGLARLEWQFYREHRWEVTLRYTGSRYDDVENRTRLDPFLLLGSRLTLFLNKNIRLLVEGNNLLNSDYEIWHGFKEAGINGWVGVNFSF